MASPVRAFGAWKLRVMVDYAEFATEHLSVAGLSATVTWTWSNCHGSATF